MNTLIVYAGKYGCTESCAEQLKSKLNGKVTIVNLDGDKVTTIEGYDNVIIGSSIYMGQINKKVKVFINNNLDQLGEKNIGLFVCCGFVEKFDEILSQNFPKELINKAVAKECFGGELNTEKMGFLYKKICKMIEKDKGTIKMKIIPENIEKLAKKFNG